jgi:hypothetical protein
LVNSTRTAIDRALTIQPNMAEALIARANWVRYVENDFAAARRDLDQAEVLQPPTAGLRAAQYQLARDQDNWPETLRLARECLKLDPQNGDYFESMAVGAFSKRAESGSFAESDRLFARAREIQGLGEPSPFTNQVALRLKWRGPEAALRLWDRAPSAQARVEVAHANLLLALGRLEEARAAANRETAAPPAFTSDARNPGPTLLALGWDDRARAWAEKSREEALKEFERGNRAPLVRASFVSAEIILGHRDSALAELKRWREETLRVPSVSRRMIEFNEGVVSLYARLGMADETVALLRELAANGYQTGGFSLRYSQSYALVRNDPRFQELMQQAEAWAKAQPDPTDL